MSLTLNQAIENLYQTFASYPLNKYMDACPCCIDKHDRNNLKSSPLRELIDLNRYSDKAMTTWGNEDDFKHFLPRIFELVMSHEGIGCTNLETIFGKLSYGHWDRWPITEQETIRDYFRTGWSHLLEEVDPKNSPDKWLCSIGIVGENLQPYLEYWVNACSVIAYKHLADFLEGEISYHSSLKTTIRPS